MTSDLGVVLPLRRRIRPYERLAVHEAGHAAVALRLGLNVLGVSLLVGKRHGETETHPHPLPDDLAVILAGEQAELLFFGNSCLHFSDRVDATHKVCAFRGVAGDDGYPKWTIRAEAEFERSRDRARELLKEPAVAAFCAALAEVLRVRKRLTGEEIEVLSLQFPDMLSAAQAYQEQCRKRLRHVMRERLVRLLSQPTLGPRAHA